MDANLEILFFFLIHKAPRYMCLLPLHFANKLTADFYGKRCILYFIYSSCHLTEQRTKDFLAYINFVLNFIPLPSPHKNVYRQIHSNFSYFPVFFHVTLLQQLYSLECYKPHRSSAVGSGSLLHLCL